MFSLGSNVKSAQLPTEKRNDFLEIFGKLKQRVLWKWEDDKLAGKPDNVMIGKWLPQDDVLAHPNVRLFISHCGKGSINEAKYHGVPILAVPIFGDQMSNAKQIENEGWAITVNIAETSKEDIHRSIQELIENQKYRNVVKTAADLYRDRPMSALDTAVYWVEYVIRHNGARHMQSQAVHMNFFQYYGLDVVGLIVAVMYIVFKIIKYLCLFLFCTKFNKRKNKFE